MVSFGMEIWSPFYFTDEKVEAQQNVMISQN